MECLCKARDPFGEVSAVRNALYVADRMAARSTRSRLDGRIDAEIGLKHLHIKVYAFFFPRKL